MTHEEFVAWEAEIELATTTEALTEIGRALVLLDVRSAWDERQRGLLSDLAFAKREKLLVGNFSPFEEEPRSRYKSLPYIVNPLVAAAVQLHANYPITTTKKDK